MTIQVWLPIVVIVHTLILLEVEAIDKAVTEVAKFDAGELNDFVVGQRAKAQWIPLR